MAMPLSIGEVIITIRWNRDCRVYRGPQSVIGLTLRKTGSWGPGTWRRTCRILSRAVEAGWYLFAIAFLLGRGRKHSGYHGYHPKRIISRRGGRNAHRKRVHLLVDKNGPFIYHPAYKKNRYTISRVCRWRKSGRALSASERA